MSQTSQKNQAGKGDKVRPHDPTKMREGWDRIWGKKEILQEPIEPATTHTEEFAAEGGTDE
jgi:hypothetical protein